jgi:hypothetical protein
MEPYETRAPDGTPIYYPDQHLVPPPPPKRRRHPLLILVIVWLSIVLILVSASAVILYERQVPVVSTPTATATSSAPTLDTDNFSRFFKAFLLLLQQHDYDSIQSATDTENFRAIPLRSSGTQDWSEFLPELTSGQMSFLISPDALTADQAGYSCFDYGPSGIGYIDYTIDALQLRYMVGTTFVLNPPPDDPLIAPNGTVFVFELPRGSSPTWLWRAVTFNNSLGCG